MTYLSRLFAGALLAVSAAAAADPLADGFRTPPWSARPQTWWHWMNGNVTADGITADLESMKAIGLGGAQIFNLSVHNPVGPAPFGSPEWWGMITHAIRTADRLGLTIGMENCPGWSESGGPWVTPDQAMERVVWTETPVRGGRSLSLALPQPATVGSWYRDIAVLAFPSRQDEAVSVAALRPKVTTNAPGVDAAPLIDGSGSRVVVFPFPTAGKPDIIQFEFARPQRWGSVRLIGNALNSVPTTGAIEASDDGISYRKVADLPEVRRNQFYAGMLVTFPETTARFYRVVVTFVYAHHSVADAKIHFHETMQLRAIEFGAARLDQSEDRAGYRPNPDLATERGTFADEAAVPVDQVLDLSARMKGGRLAWEAPKGNWTVVRLGCTLTGQMIHPAPDGGEGLEVDKMNAAAVKAHFNGMIGRVIANAGPLAGRTFKFVLADSWEAGCENWTPGFREQFRRRRGYDPLPWLPALSGRVMGSVERSERFLWDYRRTIADLIAENHYGEFRKLSHEHGMLWTAEAPGIGMPTIADELECKGRCDVPMAEFWMRPHDDSKETASAAHIYGARVVGAEAFSAGPTDAGWAKAPYDFKRIGDFNFAQGINRYVFHRFTQQPYFGLQPGFTMGPYGTNFERTNTWWYQAKAWMDYISRSQYLLQAGNPVADVCYFYGEGAPNTLAGHEPHLPPGYDYDACNAEVILTRLSVRDGRLVLPDGTSYGVLLLRDSDRMTPQVLRRIRDLVVAGATVIGRRPERSPSLGGYPGCDDEVRALGEALWGPGGNAPTVDRSVGQGRVLCGQPLAEAVAGVCRRPDFSSGDSMGEFRWLHRRVEGTDIFFVSSQNSRALTASLSFRISGRAPELWHADTGETERPAVFADDGAVTTLPVRFDPSGAVFVVFRPAESAPDPVIAVEGDGADRLRGEGPSLSFDAGGELRLRGAAAGSYVFRRARGGEIRLVVPPSPPAFPIAGPWDLRFPLKSGTVATLTLPTLASWTDQSEEPIKYFSGTAIYTRDFELPSGALAADREIWLDLGVVRDVAEVSLNGKSLGILWKPPYRARVTDVLRAGSNRLEVRVTNLWPNRLIGDMRLPPEQRQTWTTYNPYKADDPLRPSGLFGPVTLQSEANLRLK